MAQNYDQRNIEEHYPGIREFGLQTAQPVDFVSSPSVLLPANTVIGGSSVVATYTKAEIIAIAIAMG